MYYFKVLSFTRQPNFFSASNFDYLLTVVNPKRLKRKLLLTSNCILNLIGTNGIDPNRLTDEDLHNVILRLKLSKSEWNKKPDSYKEYFFPEHSDIIDDEVLLEIVSRTQLTIGELNRLKNK